MRHLVRAHDGSLTPHELPTAAFLEALESVCLAYGLCVVARGPLLLDCYSNEHAEHLWDARVSLQAMAYLAEREHGVRLVQAAEA